MTEEMASARFAFVYLVEIVALGICMVPLRKRDCPWKTDCFRFGLYTIVAALLVCSLIFSVRWILPAGSLSESARIFWPELGVALLYSLNIGCLLLVISRTGGVQASLYGPLLPMQLSAMLLLQIHKDQIGEQGAVVSWNPAFAYLAMASLAFAAIEIFPAAIKRIARFTDDPLVISYGEINRRWTLTLTLAGMALTFVTYWVPQLALFDWFKEAYSRRL